MAEKVREHLECILRLATAREYRTGDNPASMHGALQFRLKPHTNESKNHAALPYEQIGAFIADLRKVKNERSQLLSIPPIVLEFLILTAVRTEQVINLPWSEIDKVNKLWICPRHKLRKKGPHIIPLSTAAMAILKDMEDFQAAEGIISDYVFVRSPRDLPRNIAGKRMNKSALSLFVKRQLGEQRGFEATYGDYTPHGFRTTFKSWAIEMGFDDQDSERALGHVVGSEMSRLYGRQATRLEPRRQLLEAWAKYCNQPEPFTAKILPMRPAQTG
jgi:integrase